MSMFAKNLQEALSQRSITQADFARVLGVPPTTVSGWIRGAHEPSIDMLLVVCSYLNIPAGELIGDNNSYVNTGKDYLQRSTEVDDLHSRLREAEAVADKYKQLCSDLRCEVEAVKRYGDRYRSIIETLKADGAKELSIKF